MQERKQKVFVGMSGGVDSAVSAALLHEQGYDVTGVFIKTWHPDFLECSWRDDRSDAMRVAAALGIPFLTCDLEEVYKKEVGDYMIAEYAAGRTPNPDVMCNQHVKFGAFFTWARAQGADYVATGHYARAERRDDGAHLYAGVDTSKDQSYFLWTMPQEVLAHVMFPVGSMKKTEVREHARRFGLSVAEKKDSQGVCFLGPVDIKSFLKRFIDVTSGDVLDETGTVIGTHDGALLYTLGQRHGFTVTKNTPNDGPRYVIGKDLKRNTITVSMTPHEASQALSTSTTLEHVNWINRVPSSDEMLSCRFRYRQQLVPCRCERGDAGVTVHFEQPVPFVTPGQSLVVYDGEEMLGGGTVA